jgi:hypothetical protein
MLPTYPPKSISIPALYYTPCIISQKGSASFRQLYNKAKYAHQRRSWDNMASR